MSQQVEGFVFLCIVGLLKYRHIVGTTLMEIPILVRVDRINLQTDHAEILSCQLTGLTDVLYIALPSTLTCEDQDFLHT